jgi:hypothetical protein
VVTDFGIYKLEIRVLEIKLDPMVFTPFPKVIIERFMQLENALAPMLSKLFGKAMLNSPLHP